MQLAKVLAPFVAIGLFFAAGAGEENAYRLTVRGDDPEGDSRVLRTEFCLEPVKQARAEVCLGAMIGYDLWGAGGGTTTFRLSPDADGRCVCKTPTTLDAAKPLCWPEWIDLAEHEGRRLELSGFVTLLEGVHAEGDTSESCVRVDSDNTVPLIKRRKQEI